MMKSYLVFLVFAYVATVESQGFRDKLKKYFKKKDATQPTDYYQGYQGYDAMEDRTAATTPYQWKKKSVKETVQQPEEDTIPYYMKNLPPPEAFPIYDPGAGPRYKPEKIVRTPTHNYGDSGARSSSSQPLGHQRYASLHLENPFAAAAPKKENPFAVNRHATHKAEKQENPFAVSHHATHKSEKLENPFSRKEPVLVNPFAVGHNNHMPTNDLSAGGHSKSHVEEKAKIENDLQVYSDFEPYNFKSPDVKVCAMNEFLRFEEDNKYSAVIIPVHEETFGAFKQYLSNVHNFPSQAFRSAVLLHFLLHKGGFEYSYSSVISYVKDLQKTLPNLYICFHQYGDGGKILEGGGICVINRIEYRYKGSLENQNLI